MSDPKMPGDPDAEFAVLGFVLTDPIGRADLLAALAPQDFAEGSARGKVWEACQQVAAKHGAVELIEELVRDWLRQNDPDAGSSIWTMQQARTRELPLDPGGTVRMDLARAVRRMARQREGIKQFSPYYSQLYERDCDPVATVEGFGRFCTDLSALWREADGDTSTNSTFHRSPDWPGPPHEAAMYGLAGRVVDLLKPHTEADPAALLAQFLVYAAAHFGPEPHFWHESTKHHLNLYSVLVGPSGRGRKGTSRDRIESVFHDVDEEWAEQHTLSGLSSGEGLIAAVRDREDGTAAMKNMLVIEPEFAGPLEQMRRDGNILSVVLRLLWDSSSARTLTKADPLTATGVHLSMIGHITEDDLQKHMTSALAGDGLGNRILWVASRRAQLLPFGGDREPKGLSDLQGELREAVALAQRVGSVNMNHDARDLWEQVYPKLSRDRLGMFGKLTGRAEAQTRRLACLYALLDLTNMVRHEHLTAALAFWDYCERTVAHVFGDRLGDALADKLLAAIRESGRRGKLTTELWDVAGHKTKAETLHAKLAMLLRHGLVTCESVPAQSGGQKPAERYRATTSSTEEWWKVELVESARQEQAG